MSAKKSSNSVKKSEPETFDAREVVLGKIRGFPPWPGMVSSTSPNFLDFFLQSSLAFWASLGLGRLRRLFLAPIEGFCGSSDARGPHGGPEVTGRMAVARYSVEGT
ncbi:hypothetical protein C8F04DRAFT_1190562 [Mycena alexandri]|uniref:PWWP domain-containing protein n=1 Tax=Mycena alexandri TaxID=1745969 RepID=A0AAD6SG18_9AGAR|nr:hypothetical protein C8F04DRAFT_1190562 [Mycena alexandri]